MDQGTTEWHAARLGKITASGFSNIMKEVKAGESTYKTKYRQELAIERVTGKVANEVLMNQFMRDGVEREPIARQLFINKSGLDVDEVGFIDHPSILMSGASPDGMIKSEDAVL